MDTQAELNVSEAKPVLESEVNCDSFGLDSAHNAKINTTESITEDVDVSSAEVPVVETVNALAKDKFEDQETEDKKERDIIETVGINEISIGQHSDVCQSEMLKDAEKDDLEGIRQGTDLEAGMNAIPALSNTKKNVGSDFCDHPQGNMDAEVSVDSNDKAITSEVITTEISEMKSTDVVPLSDNERMAADGIPTTEPTNETIDESLLVNEESSSPGILKMPEDGIPAKEHTNEVADESLLVNEESSSQGILKTPEDGIPAKEHTNEVADESLLVNEESSSQGILKTPEDGIPAKEHTNEVADESLLVNEESSSPGILKMPEDGIPAKDSTNEVADESLLVNEESSSQGILKTPEDGIPAKEHTNEVADESLLVNEEPHSQVISETAPKLSSVENNSPTKCANESAIVTATDYPASSTDEVVSSTQLELESRDETALKDVTEVLTAEVSDGQEVILPLSPSDVSQHVADEHDVSNVEQMIAIDAGHSESLTQQPALAEGCVSTTPFENGHKETVELKIAECSSDSSDFVPMDTNMGGGAPEDNLESLSQDSIAPEEKTFGPSTENVVVSGESVEEKVSRPSSGQEISEHSQNIEAVPDLSVDLTVMTQEHSDPEPLSEESIDMPESRNDITVTEISDLSTETPEVSIDKTEINIPLHISSEVHKEIVTISVAKEEGTSESSIEKVKVASEVPAENGVDDVIISEVAITEAKAECEGVGTSDDPKSISQPEKEIPENKQEEVVECATITSELTHGGNSSTSATEATESDQLSIVTTEHAEISSVTQTTVIVETTETKTEIIETDYDKSKKGGELTSEIDELPKVDEETDKKDDNPTEVPLKDEESEVIVAPDDRDEEEKGQKGIAMDKAQEEKEIICSVEQSDECREGTENAGNREEEPIPEKTGMKRSQGCCVIS